MFMQILTVHVKHHTLTHEQKERIAKGPGLDEFLPDAAPEEESKDTTKYTGPLKSKSGERYIIQLVKHNCWLSWVLG
jgi:hypothetical protein